MKRKKRMTAEEWAAWNDRTRRIDERLGGIFSTTTFDERTRMVEARIAELEERAARKAGEPQ